MSLAALSLLTASAHRAAVGGLEYVHLTGPQEDWVRRDDPEAYWIDGNALGKSFAAAWDAVAYCTGTHPFKKKRGGGPVHGLVIGYSFEQMLPLMEKLWALTPKNRVHPSCGFVEGHGFVGKIPRLIFIDPETGRITGRITFKTYRGRSAAVAGGQYDFVICDEPPPPSIIGEVRPRVLRKRGWFRVLMTPVPDMPDQTALRELIEAGRVPHQNVHLTERSCWPKGYPAPWHYQDEIDAYALTLLPHERDMRIKGSLRPVVTGRWMHAFDPDRHVTPIRVKELVGWQLALGIDHGTTGRKQAAVLVATRVVTRDGQRRPQARFLAETVSKGFTTPEHDARAIRTMLERRGIPLDAVDYLVGDVATHSRTRDVSKSNDELRAALAAEYNRPVRTVRRIETPSKGPGSLTDGGRTLNTLYARDDALVDPSCEQTIEANLVFDGDPNHPLKDVWDGGRYATLRGIGGPIDRALVAHY